MIRLTLILLAGLFGAMLVFGEDTPELAAAQIDESVLEPGTEAAESAAEPAVIIEPVEITDTEVAQTKDVETVAETVEQAVAEATTPLAETAKQNVIDLTRPRAFDGLLVVNSTDSSSDAVQAAAESITAAIEDAAGSNAVDAIKLYRVTGSSVNLRAGPSTGVAVVGNLRRGDRAEFLSEAGSGWWQIRDTDTGQVGFMAARFLAPVE